MNRNGGTRREFLATAAALGAGSAIAGAAPTAAAQAPYRLLGKTGLKILMLSPGGWHSGRMKEENNALRFLNMAADEGVNFFDTAWVYQDGESEARIGKAFQGGRRQKVLLMSKVMARDKAGAERQLNDSLRRLRTDYIDLWQFHGLVRDEEVEQIFAPGGAVETALKAKQEGKILHIGITGHKPSPLRKAIREHHGILETVQMPMNVIDPNYQSLIQGVVPEATRHNLGILAMKTCAIGLLLEARVATVDECLNYVWSLPVSAIVSGMDHFDHLKHNLKLARSFRPMAGKERRALLASAKTKGDPRLEWYKFDDGKMRTYPADALL